MLYAAKVLCNILNIFNGDNTPYRIDCCQVVFHVVHAGDTNIILMDDRRIFSVFGIAQHAVLAKVSTERRLCLTGKSRQCSAYHRCQFHGRCIVLVQNGSGECILVCQNIRFCVDILFHCAVYIQMVRCNVGDNGNIGRLAHRKQLEAGKLYHCHIVFPDLFDDRKQRAADISALMHPESGAGEKF